MKKVLIVLLALINNICAYSQEYIVFERQQATSFKPLKSAIALSQNEVILRLKDTTLSLFNFYYTSDSLGLYHLNSKSLDVKPDDLKAFTNDIVITTIPIVKPGQQLSLKKVSAGELHKLQVVSAEQLLNRNIPRLFVHSKSDLFKMPALKTLQYGLIIKVNNDYYKVEQPTLTVVHLVCNNDWYFPNEFKDGIISTGKQFVKTYNMPDFKKIQQETNNSKAVYKQISNRTYLANIDKSNAFGIDMYDYWEFLNDDATSIHLNPKSLEQHHPGLGSFTLLPKIGIVNCSMDYYLKGKILYNQKPPFEIISVNNLDPKVIGKRIKARSAGLIKAAEGY